MVLNGKLHNKISVGRSRIRLEDIAQSNTLKVLEMWGWRKRHEDREKWRRFLREVRAQKGM